MERPPAARLLASLIPLFAFQALFQILQVDVRKPWGWSMSWPNDWLWQLALLITLVAAVISVVAIVGSAVPKFKDWGNHSVWKVAVMASVCLAVGVSVAAFLITREPSRFWSDQLVWQIVVVSALATSLAIALGFLAKPKDLNDTRRKFASGFPPTAPLLPPVYTLAVLALMYGPTLDGRLSRRETLVASVVIAFTCWIVFALWRGIQASARGVVPELFESLKSEYLALCTELPLRSSSADEDSDEAESEEDRPILKLGTPAATDAPLPKDRLNVYLRAVGLQLDFEDRYTLPVGFRVSPRAWNSGSAYLEAQRRLAYVRDSRIALQRDKAQLLGHAFALELRLSGANLGDKVLLVEHLKAAKDNIANGTDLIAQAETLFTIASTISSYIYSRQRALLRVQMQQHWLVVLVQMIAALILSIVVLAGANGDSIGASIMFFLIGAGSGILSLLHVRQAEVTGDLGDDYGLFRVELARAFTLSGMAALIGVYLIANLPVLAGTGIFDPPTPATGTPESPSPTIVMIVEPTEPVEATLTTSLQWPAPPRSLVQPFSHPGISSNVMVFQTQIPPSDEVDPPEEWRPLEDIFAFGNLGGFLVALLSGWVPERVFRSLTNYGNRLRLDIQSVSRAGG